jgi:hypothetical protein
MIYFPWHNIHVSSEPIECVCHSKGDTPIIGESFYVIAECNDGMRFRHDISFNTIDPQWVTDEETGEKFFVVHNLFERALAEAEAMCARINRHAHTGHELNLRKC